MESEHLGPIFEGIKVQPEDVAKLAVGKQKYEKITGRSMNPWEELLAEILVGDAFGVDRMDYLLRDSYHAGVAYGRFDHERLIDTLRLLPREPESPEPWIGVEKGGIHSVLALAYARYFMYLQVYFHRVRVAYDFHLKHFLSEWLPGGRFSIDLEDHLAMTDNEVSAALLEVARSDERPGSLPARRLLERDHLRLLYERREVDVKANRHIVSVVHRAAAEEFGENKVQSETYQKRSVLDFPVLSEDGTVHRSTAVSEEFAKIPEIKFGYVFVVPELADKAVQWLKRALPGLLEAPAEDDEEDEP